MFSQTVEYALRAVVFLGMRFPEPQKTADIAVATKIPMAYLSKVLQGLQQQKLVHLQRGVGGGVSLAYPPSELSILDIVNSVEPIQRIQTCPLELKSHGKRLCSLHAKMDAALSDMEKAFGSTTLSDLIKERRPSIPLCESE